MWPLLAFLAASPAHAAELSAVLKAPAGLKLETLVVWAKAKPGKAPAPTTVTITQRAQEFAPAVLAIPAGTEVRFENLDTIAHNVFSLDAGNVFDLGMNLPKKASPARKFEKSGRYHVFCNIHPKMHLVVDVLGHGAVAHPGADGRFTLAWEGKKPAEWAALVDGPGWSEPHAVTFHKDGDGYLGELTEGARASVPEHRRKDGSSYPDESAPPQY